MPWRYLQRVARYSVLTDSKAGIVDLTGVSEFPVSSEFVRRLAMSERPRVVIAPQTHAFGLVRMFQIVGGRTRPLFSVVMTMEEALKVLRASTPDFKPIEF